MGERAVITTAKVTKRNYKKCETPALYTHWCGGFDYMSALLLYCKLHDYPSPEVDAAGYDALARVINCYTDDDVTHMSIANKCINPGLDEGVYIVKDWEIVGRLNFFPIEEYDRYTVAELLPEIDNAQPPDERLPRKVLIAAVKEANRNL